MVKREIKLILAAVICIVSAQLLLKYGLKSAAHTELELGTVVTFLTSILLNPYVILGVILLIISAILWMMVLSKFELSYAYPALSLGYALAAIGAWLLFNESLSMPRIAGIIVICSGVYALSRS